MENILSSVASCDMIIKKGGDPMQKSVKIEYLYLDLNTCDRCCGTDVVLDEVVSLLRPVLETAGYQLDYEKVEMTTVKDAVRYEFLSSPTIRVNGKDICTSVKENACGCCSDISGTDVTCRVFTYEGADYEVAPKAMLVEEILRRVFSVLAQPARRHVIEHIHRRRPREETDDDARCNFDD